MVKFKNFKKFIVLPYFNLNEGNLNHFNRQRRNLEVLPSSISLTFVNPRRGSGKGSIKSLDARHCSEIGKRKNVYLWKRS